MVQPRSHCTITYDVRRQINNPHTKFKSCACSSFMLFICPGVLSYNYNNMNLGQLTIDSCWPKIRDWTPSLLPTWIWVIVSLFWQCSALIAGVYVGRCLKRESKRTFWLSTFLWSRGGCRVSEHVTVQWEELDKGHSFLSWSHWILGPKIAWQKVYRGPLQQILPDVGCVQQLTYCATKLFQMQMGDIHSRREKEDNTR